MHNYDRLDVWKRGKALAGELLVMARGSTRVGDREFWGQVTRAAMSIPSNIAEGAQRGTDREFARFLAIAMGSAAELHTLLRLAADAELLPGNDAQRLAEEAITLRRMAASLRYTITQRLQKTRPPAPPAPRVRHTP